MHGFAVPKVFADKSSHNVHFFGRRSCRAVRTYVQCLPQGVHRPRNAQASPLYRLVEDHFDELERVWDGRYEREHGFWRPVARQVVEQFLDCSRTWPIHLKTRSGVSFSAALALPRSCGRSCARRTCWRISLRLESLKLNFPDLTPVKETSTGPFPVRRGRPARLAVLEQKQRSSCCQLPQERGATGFFGFSKEAS
jgi:hypothetical protein